MTNIYDKLDEILHEVEKRLEDSDAGKETLMLVHCGYEELGRLERMVEECDDNDQIAVLMYRVVAIRVTLEALDQGLARLQRLQCLVL